MKPHFKNRQQNAPSGKTIRTHKWYFAIYSNMARHNAFKAIKTISEHYKQLTGKGVEFKEDNVKNAPLFEHLFGEKIFSKSGANGFVPNPLGDTIKITDRFKGTEQQKDVLEKIWLEFSYHFPVVEVIKNIREQSHRARRKRDGILDQEAEGNRYEEILYSIATLQYMLAVLHELRNYCSHETEKQNEGIFKSNLKGILPLVYNQAVYELEVKENYDPKDLAHLNNPDNYQYKNYAVNEALIAENFIRYFLCLFLANTEGHTFLKQIEGFKGAGFKHFGATPTCYTMYSLRLPEPVFNPYQNDDALLMDALNYLRKAPVELFDVLMPRDKSTFEADPVKDYDEGDELNKYQNNRNKLEKVKLIRYTNRFIPFALNWLGKGFVEQEKEGMVYAFELQLAKVKEIVEITPNESTSVQVQKDKLVRTFGLPKYWNSVAEIDHAGKKWKLNPSFATEDKQMNIIGVKKIKTTELENPQFNSLEIKGLFPDFYLSLSELKNIVMAELAKKGAAILTFDRIEGIQNNIFNLIESETEINSLVPKLLKALEGLEKTHGEGFVRKVIPKKVLSIISNSPEENKWLPKTKPLFPEKYETKQIVLKRIAWKLNDTSERKSDIKKYRDDMAKYRSGGLPKKLRPGELAHWLIQDINYYLPLDDKLSSAKYNELHRRIALYETESNNGEEVLGYMKRIKLIEIGADKAVSSAHQFLSGLLVDGKLPAKNLEFYEKYLNAKEGWLKRVLKKIEEKCGTEEEFRRNFNNEIQYFTSGEVVSTSVEISTDKETKNREWFKTIDLGWMQNYINNLRNQPKYFPTGVFLDNAGNEKEIREKYTAPQQMYMFERTYLLKKGLKDKDNPNNNKPNIYFNLKDTNGSLKELFKQDSGFQNFVRLTGKYPEKVKQKKNEIYDNEQIIRYHSACDGLLWDIARGQLADRLKVDKDTIKFDDANLFEKEIELEILDGLRTKIKIKDFGRYRKYRNDRRLIRETSKDGKSNSTIGDYLNKGNITPDDVQKELNLYDKQRGQFLDLCYKLEAKIKENKDTWGISEQDQLEYDKTKEPSKTHQLKDYYGFDYLLKKAVDANFITKQRASILRWSRNAALHNQLPRLSELEAEGIDIGLIKNEKYFNEAINIANDILK